MNNYLHNIYKILKDEFCDGKHDICLLKDLNFIDDNLPNYDNEYLQALYLLRYANAYTFEYASMFEALDWNENTLSILSIGCGEKLDYLAACHWVDASNHSNIKINYTGVDLVEWSDRFSVPIREADTVIFKNQDIIDYLNSQKSIDADLVIFPKSISEFNKDQFNMLCDTLCKKNSSKKHFNIFASLRFAPSDGYEHDLDKVLLLKQALEYNSFKCIDDGVLYYNNEKMAKKNYFEFDNYFSYPSEIIEFIINLESCCFKKEKTCKEDCKSVLNRYPLLSCTDMRNYIGCFERK